MNSSDMKKYDADNGIVGAASDLLIDNEHLTSTSITPLSASTDGHEQDDTESPVITPGTPLSSSSEPNSGILDLICVGFGPASLAIAIAINDIFPAQTRPRCLHLEKQSQFAWHSGMQIPGAKMQISFLKDLATPRQPTSTFTFLNYLQSVGRLHAFINLSTFLPSRKEFEAYLKWCARRFEEQDRVRYGIEVVAINPDTTENGKVTSWEVVGRTVHGDAVTWKTKKVVVAPGGKPVLPEHLRGISHIYHSSQYIHQISNIESQLRNNSGSEGRKLKFAVVGGGQSAAEIFSDLWERFPEADVKLIIKGSSLRPSDDSPFVNEIFDPERVSQIFSLPPEVRAQAIEQDKSTNYSVVRLELLEHLYEKLYMQRLDTPNENNWRCRIIPNRVIKSANPPGQDRGLKLNLAETRDLLITSEADAFVDRHEEFLEVDYLFTAVGYLHNFHEDILAPTENLLPVPSTTGMETTNTKFRVGRDYRVQYDNDKVDGEQAGIWLQGCNEATHGLSDTLLSILAVRAGELVHSIFAADIQQQTENEKQYL